MAISLDGFKRGLGKLVKIQLVLKTKYYFRNEGSMLIAGEQWQERICLHLNL